MPTADQLLAAVPSVSVANSNWKLPSRRHRRLPRNVLSIITNREDAAFFICSGVRYKLRRTPKVSRGRVQCGEGGGRGARGCGYQLPWASLPPLSPCSPRLPLRREPFDLAGSVHGPFVNLSLSAASLRQVGRGRCWLHPHSPHLSTLNASSLFPRHHPCIVRGSSGLRL